MFAEACVSVLCCLVTQTTSRKRASKPLHLSFKKVFGDDSSAVSLGSMSAAEGEEKVGFGDREQQKMAHPEALLWGASSGGQFTEGIIAELQIEFPPCNL